MGVILIKVLNSVIMIVGGGELEIDSKIFDLSVFKSNFRIFKSLF